MLNKMIIRRQVENNELTNIQMFLFWEDGRIESDLSIIAADANQYEQNAHDFGMKREIRRTDLENAFIHVTTWLK